MIISLTSDFGTRDPFVGQIKGVILGIEPTCTIVDLSHEVPPQDILAGALILESVLGVFPPRAIHVGVVDPGVGTSRAAIAVETDQGIFIGPDNGLLSAVLQRTSLRRAVRLTNPHYHRPIVSATFHGRDIFAPAAAHLARGVALSELGEAIHSITMLPLPEPLLRGGALEIHVVSVDRFGNLITDLTLDRFTAWRGEAPATTPVVIDVGRVTISEISRTYSDVQPEEPIAYFGSNGRLEVAVREGSAAATFGPQSAMLVRLLRV